MVPNKNIEVQSFDTNCLLFCLFICVGDLVITPVPTEPLMGGNLTLTCVNTDQQTIDFIDWQDDNGDYIIGSK